MILQYICSDGTVFDLKTSRLRAKSGNFHAYGWKMQTTKMQYGERVNRIDKAPATYTAKLTLQGPTEERKQILNRMHQCFERDIRNETPGRIVHGKDYIECYITASDTRYENPWAANTISIYCPYPFWIRESTYSYPERQYSESEFLEFPYGFPYDYTASFAAQDVLRNTSQAPARFRITIYGSASTPTILIDDHAIGFISSVAEGEYAVIDSTENTVHKISVSGTKYNLYNSRFKGEESIFAPISPGTHALSWSGAFGFDITIYEERSEPEWS